MSDDPRPLYVYPDPPLLPGEIPVEITRSRTVQLFGSYEKVGLRLTFPVRRPKSMRDFAKQIASLFSWVDDRLDVHEMLLRQRLAERALREGSLEEDPWEDLPLPWEVFDVGIGD